MDSQNIFLNPNLKRACGPVNFSFPPSIPLKTSIYLSEKSFSVTLRILFSMEYILKKKKEDDTTCQLADGNALYYMHMYTLHYTRYSVKVQIISVLFYSSPQRDIPSSIYCFIPLSHNRSSTSESYCPIVGTAGSTYPVAYEVT